MCLLIVFFLIINSHCVFRTCFSSKFFSRRGPQDFLVTDYDCEANQQKTLRRYANNQVTQCQSKTQDLESTNIEATFYSKARSTTLKGYKIKAKVLEKKSKLLTSLKKKPKLTRPQTDFSK